MKKYLALLMAAMMILSCLAGCGNNDAPADNGNQNAGNNQTNTNTNTNTNTTPEVEGPHVGPDGRVAREDQTYHSTYSSELTTPFLFKKLVLSIILCMLLLVV